MASFAFMTEKEYTRYVETTSLYAVVNTDEQASLRCVALGSPEVNTGSGQTGCFSF